MARYGGGLVVLLALFTPRLGGQTADPKDPATWTPFKFAGKPRAPEFADIDTWINSKPLTLARLKGQVVVVHFLAFG
jgi:hypothetical protein